MHDGGERQDNNQNDEVEHEDYDDNVNDHNNDDAKYENNDETEEKLKRTHKTTRTITKTTQTMRTTIFCVVSGRRYRTRTNTKEKDVNPDRTDTNLRNKNVFGEKHKCRPG